MIPKVTLKFIREGSSFFVSVKENSPYSFAFCLIFLRSIGRNYVAHVKELGNEIPKEPVLVSP